MITTILFDLDGTLLPMDNEIFTKAYFHSLAAKVKPLGYEKEKLVDAVCRGTAAMVKNDGKNTNEEVFWNTFCEILGEKVLKDKSVFDEYYRNEFQQLSTVCGCNKDAKRIVDMCREKGYRIALATNPVFPAVATESRIKWAGLEPMDFEYYTTYENSTHCKPNPKYYEGLLSVLKCKPEECLLVGNDVKEDMIAQDIGMKVFLLTDCMVNKEGKDITCYPQGGFDELWDYIAGL